MTFDSARQPSRANDGLTSISFLGYLATQFLGAVNDSMFRWLVVPIAKYKVVSEYHLDARYEAVALSAGLACFVLPYIIFASHAGYLSDRFSKRAVTVGCKVGEVVIMLLGLAAVWYGNMFVLYAVLFLMGTQSALFGPAKLGIIPELVRPDLISAANGVVGLLTVIAVVIGTVAGNYLYEVTQPDGIPLLWVSAIALIGVATVGLVVSLAIRRLPIANPTRAFPWNPAVEAWNDVRLVASNRGILRVTLGIAFFWGLASLAQLNVDTYAVRHLLLEQKEVGPLLGILSLGVGLGSVLAGYWSAGRVELGIVPLGAIAIAVSAMLLSATENSWGWSAAMLFGLGAGGGMFNVPLNAYIQERSPPESLGAVLAAGNLITFAGMLIVSVVFPLLHSGLGLDASQVFLITGIGTIPVALYVIFVIPTATLRFIAWLASRLIYRIRISGEHNLPPAGGALLVSNHVSWIDGVLLLTVSARPIRMLVYADYTRGWLLRRLAKLFKVIPVRAGDGGRQILKSLATAREAVQNGDLVCIFAEGAITRTGQLQAFQSGLTRIVRGTTIPVIPVYLDELWGSVFSFSRGRFFWKRPRMWRSPVSISFGTPLSETDSPYAVRRAVEELGANSMERRMSREMIPARRFLRQCKSSLFRMKVADSAGVELTGGKLLTGALMLKRLLERKVFQPDEKMVGLWLPPSVGGAVTNAAVTLAGRVSVNLNYTLSNNVVNFCARECKLTHVLTSRRFLEKKPLDVDAELVYLEDLKEQATLLDKAISAAAAYTLPTGVLDMYLGLTKIDPAELLTVIFTSGSTGEPKGVMLSHQNVQSNIGAVNNLFNLTRQDVLIGVLPFFHSFGFTVTLWLPLASNPACAYHFNPLDGRTVGKLCEKYGVTILAATPTFLRTYLKRCEPEQMKTLDLAIVGAEKLPADLAAAFKAKFGVEPTEGYGTTELSPVAAFNVPAHRSGSSEQTGTRMGTVGRVMPGAAARIIDPDTGTELGTNQPGLLLIKGPNVMLGYLNLEDKTQQSLRDGWYNTGDIAKIDDDGFIEITGRQSRFSKIGGEMVPHILIEEHLARIVDTGDAEEAGIQIAVTAVPDEKKGERLVVLHRPVSKPIDEILRELGATGLPNIWLPAKDCFFEVEDIPLLGTGKLDLRGLNDLARTMTQC